MLFSQKDSKRFSESHVLGGAAVLELIEALREVSFKLQRSLVDHIFDPFYFENKIEWPYIQMSFYYLSCNAFLIHRAGLFRTHSETKRLAKELTLMSNDKIEKEIEKLFKTTIEEEGILTIPPKKRGKTFSNESLFIKGALENMAKTIFKDGIMSPTAISKMIGGETSPQRVNNLMFTLVREGKLKKVTGGFKVI